MEFDYVIIGGGSAGSVLAARLSESGRHSVCLIEAGGEGRSLLVRMPAAAVAMLPGWGKINNWAFHTTRQPELRGRRGYQPRGRALGGSSAINAQLYLRGHADDYDEWAALGCTGWDWHSVLPWFKRAENNQHGPDDFHGAEGPLHVSDQRDPRPVSRAFVEAAQSLQIPHSADFNRGDNFGAGLYQVTQFHDAARQGERCSAAAAYLHPLLGSATRRSNLELLTKTRVARIVLEHGRATGVEILRGTTRQTIRARAEVILSAGAFGSPQILQLSGIGRPEDITPHGLPLRHHAPEVGQDLQDHLDFTQIFSGRDADLFGIGLRGAPAMLRHLRNWRRDGSGMMATPFAEGGAFLRTDPALSRPDVQLHFVVAIVQDHARRLRRGYGWSCHMCQLRPYSRGQVTLGSANPTDDPKINPRFLSDPRDLPVMIAGARLTRRLLLADALAPFRGRALDGLEDAPDDAAFEAAIRATADTIYHPVGTCRMGGDDRSVVDPQLRLRGIDGLRVVDASVMPRLIGGNTNAPTIMIAERAAAMILGQAS